MRYGIFADVHSNIAAFGAVHNALEKAAVDQYVFVGDIVGYGAHPCECIALLRKLNAVIVSGNHDLAIIDSFDVNRFNESAKKAIIWTKDHTSHIEKSFLAGLRLSEEDGAFHLVHGTLNHPENFDYMINKSEAMKTFYAMKHQICFVGHSHVPGVFVEEKENIRYRIVPSLLLERDRRYIINVGSVGQPRDENKDACFCIYDEDAATIEIKRVSYDIAKAQKDILDAGLPPDLAKRLALGR